MRDGEPPEGVPASEIVVLHEPEAERSLVILLFESEDDYRRGDETLGAMAAGKTPGRRAAVTRYDVAARISARRRRRAQRSALGVPWRARDAGILAARVSVVDGGGRPR